MPFSLENDNKSYTVTQISSGISMNPCSLSEWFTLLCSNFVNWSEFSRTDVIANYRFLFERKKHDASCIKRHFALDRESLTARIHLLGRCKTKEKHANDE